MDVLDTKDVLKFALHAFAIAYGKCIDLAYNELGRGNVKDAEDCWLDHYGISVDMEDTLENVLELLRAAYDMVHEKVNEPWREEILRRFDTREVGLQFGLDTDSRSLAVAIELSALPPWTARTAALLYRSDPFGHRLDLL
jgi:hypothetical protein